MSAAGSFPTVLEKRYFEPFDLTYLDVTKRMKVAADHLTGVDQAWLARLIDTFAAKRACWNHLSELDSYRRRWRQLRTRFLRLVAGAYLHISYDLPRAIADDWPGQGSWTLGPTQIRGQQIYSEVRNVFPMTLRRVSRDVRIIGWIAIVLSPLSPKMLATLGHWMLHLRRAAWEHAAVLATQPDRARREQAMAQAMCAALEDVSDFRPWTGLLLEPLDQVLYTPFWPYLAALLGSLEPTFRDIGIATGVWFMLSGLQSRRRQRSLESMVFAEAFAQRLLVYLNVAVRNPEGLASYLTGVRSASGFAPREGGSEAPFR